MKSLYLLINFLSVVVPFAFSFHPKIKFYKHFISFFISNLIISTAFVFWDSYFTSIGVWGFSKKYTLGIYFLGLPLEEILFFVCIPFSCVFTYFCLDKFFNLNYNIIFEKKLITGFSVLLIIAGIYFSQKLYTSSVFISLGIFFLLLYLVKMQGLLLKIINIYIVLLFPFLVVNGILTGTCLDEPVVWYNNSQNLNIRIHTIPIEDIFYGLLLFSLNVVLFNKTCANKKY